jgi:hypothetical protein
MLSLYYAYALLMLCIYIGYKLYGLGRFGLVPSLRGGLGSGVRVWVSPGGWGGGESPPHWDILKRKKLYGLGLAYPEHILRIVIK